MPDRQSDQAHHLARLRSVFRGAQQCVRRTRIHWLTAQQRWVDVAAYDDT
jgi:hypothetical protein